MNNTHLKPRKLPTQGRAKNTVNVILEATAHIFIEQGYAGITTNSVAELAGVSIGSLYQYFPNKQALIYSLYQQHREKMQSVLSKEVQLPLNISNENAIRDLIQAIVNAHLVEPLLHQRFEEIKDNIVLANEMNRYEFSSIAEHLNNKFIENKNELHISCSEATTFIIIQTVHTIVHEIIRKKHTSDYAQIMITELAQMIYGYLSYKKS